MKLPLSKDRLIHISKATKLEISNWKEGVSIENDSKLSISELVCFIASDRWQLASDHKGQADLLLQEELRLYRSAISRYYYAMYHAMRACIYIFHGGDDYQEHAKLSQYIPSDFSTSKDWQTVLKDARLTRNRADYDPYPKLNRSWKADAINIKKEADELLIVTRRYLRSKGCKL